MTPSAFFDAFVELNLCDFRERPGDIRLALNAAVSASHFADHYFTFKKRHNPRLVAQFSSIGELVEHISNATAGAFRDVRSVSNVYKHLYTDTGPLAQYTSVDSCGSIETIDVPGNDAVQRIDADYVQESNGRGKSVVVVTRKNGSRFELLPAIEESMNYLRRLAYENG